MNKPFIQGMATVIKGVLMLPLTLGVATAAVVVPGPPWVPQSAVFDSVTDNGDGTWTYEFTVLNVSYFSPDGLDEAPLIVDWEIPYFGDAGITNITAPDGWSYAIETIGVSNSATGWAGTASWQDPADPMYAGPTSPYTTVTQVLHWYNTCWVTAGECLDLEFWDTAIGPGDALDGFGFIADYDSQNGPYQASWDFFDVISGDPQLPFTGVPASPEAGGNNQIPEPGVWLLVSLGLVGLGYRKAR